MVMTSRYLQGGILLLTVFVAWQAFQRYEMAVDMRERRVEAEQEAAALEARKDALEAKVEYLSNERGIEAEMRRQFDVTKDGEQVVVIVEPEEESEIKPIATSTSKNAPWYQFWR